MPSVEVVVKSGISKLAHPRSVTFKKAYSQTTPTLYKTWSAMKNSAHCGETVSASSKKQTARYTAIINIASKTWIADMPSLSWDRA
ncbi:MAG: hypothetical protein OHK0035_07190 [Cyanobacteria bacterium J069]